MERLQCSLGRLSIPGTTPPHQRVSVNELVPPDELQASFVREVCSDARLPAGAAHLACSAEEPALLAWGDGSQVHLQLDASRGVARTPATALPRDRCHAAGAVSALFFSAGSPPVLMVLAGEFASAYAVSLTDAVPSGSLVGRWKASRALRWRGAAWHPCVVDIAALMTQQELAIISMDSLIPEASCGDISTSSFTAASPEFQAMARLAAPRSRGIGPCALCWAEDGQTLVVSWGTTLELLRWPHGADPQAVADGGPTAWAEAACARRTLLLGLGEPLRCLASVPGGGVVGTIDAPVPLSMSGSLGVGGDEAGQVVSALNAAVKEAALDEQPAVVDLRGRFAAPGQPGITVPSQFLLNGIPEPGIASQQAALQSARLVVVKPSVLVRDSGRRADSSVPVDPSFVLPLGLPLPDILKATKAAVVAVASSTGPPVVQLFIIKEKGLEPLSNVLLTLVPSGLPQPPTRMPANSVSARLRGLEMRMAGLSLEHPVQRLVLHGLQARRIAEGAPLTSASMQASLTLGKYVMMAEGVPGVGGYMANDHKAKAITGTQTSAHEGSAAHGNHSGSSCTLSDTFAAQMMVDGLAGLIAGLQAHLDRRLDVFGQTLKEHDDRLKEIEDQMLSTRALPKGG